MNEDHSTEGKPQQKLWTRDFTIITLGSVVSMVGGTMTGFAISIMVLDYTGSTFLYALFNICFQRSPCWSVPCWQDLSWTA